MAKNFTPSGFREIRKPFRSNARWHGRRYYIMRLCGNYCLLDHFTEDPDYTIEDAHGRIYFDKIILAVPVTRKSLAKLKQHGMQLELDALRTYRR